MVRDSACLCMYVSREQEQKVKAQLCQTYNLVKKDQSANTTAVKVSMEILFVSCTNDCLVSEQFMVIEL